MYLIYIPTLYCFFGYWNPIEFMKLLLQLSDLIIVVHS